MLTKDERKAIAERICKCNDVCVYDLYKAVFGEEAQDTTSYKDDVDTILRRLNDLCDTSNMTELPIDKDGEVIHIGDMVDNMADGKIYRVRGYEFRPDGCSVLLASDRSHIWTYSRPNVLVHKKPVTIASLAEHLRDILQTVEGMDDSAYRELSDIADNLEILGDSDD